MYLYTYWWLITESFGEKYGGRVLPYFLAGEGVGWVFRWARWSSGVLTISRKLSSVAGSFGM